MVKKYYTVDELAEHYGVSPYTVKTWKKKGCPYFLERRIGRKPRLMFDPEEVEDFLKIGIRRPENEKQV